MHTHFLCQHIQNLRSRRPPLPNRTAYGLGLLVLIGVVGIASSVRITESSTPTDAITLIRAQKVPNTGWFQGGGDVWIVDETGQRERRLTTAGVYAHLAGDAGRIAFIGEGLGNIFVLRSPDWRPRGVTSKGNFNGTPCWAPGKNWLLVGRVKGEGQDDGLWLVDTSRRTTRKVLREQDSDLPLNENVKVSPAGKRVLSFGTVTGETVIQIWDMTTMRRLPQPGNKGMLGVTDVEWLDERTLLLAVTADPAGVGTDIGAGGIRRLDLVTRRMERWLYGSTTDVVQVQRSPKGDRLAVGLDGVDVPSWLPSMSRRVVLVDPRTKKGQALSLPGPSHICGFSRDGSRLLILTRDATGRTANAYVVSLDDGKSRLLARGVSEAVWIEAP
jgi:hypothetical protein